MNRIFRILIVATTLSASTQAMANGEVELLTTGQNFGTWPALGVLAGINLGSRVTLGIGIDGRYQTSEWAGAESRSWRVGAPVSLKFLFREPGLNKLLPYTRLMLAYTYSGFRSRPSPAAGIGGLGGAAGVFGATSESETNSHGVAANATVGLRYDFSSPLSLFTEFGVGYEYDISRTEGEDDSINSGIAAIMRFGVAVRF